MARHSELVSESVRKPGKILKQVQDDAFIIRLFLWVTIFIQL